jgi:ribosomal protein S18 acetylase RimI-like enzyme
MIITQAASRLDNPVWAALTTGNASLAEGGPLARRFHPNVGPFAGVVDMTAPALEALAMLVPPEGRLVLESVDRIDAPAGLAIDMQAPILQMILNAPARGGAGPDHVLLGKADVPDMMDLAGRTRPGPFGSRTIEFGRYIGLRADGALAAMAGERMRFDRFVEISAVCVDPAHRGKGCGALLIMRLARAIQAQGLTAFLHVFADNANAIRLYEKLGFTTRGTFYVTSLRAAPGGLSGALTSKFKGATAAFAHPTAHVTRRRNSRT